MKYSVLCALLISVGSVGLASANAPVNASSMLGEYELIEFNSRSAQISLPVEPALTLTISKGGKLSGFAGCNQYRGSLKSSPVSVGAVAATRKMCSDPSAMQLEQQFLNVLGKATKLERSAPGEIILQDAENQSLRFKMRPSKPVEKIIWVGAEKRPCSAGVMKTECLQYKTIANGQWLNFYGAIDGFDWQAGKNYTLKVREEKIANPPADASAIKTSLIEILEVK